ncbi:DNA binding protein [Acinetobacter virus vB_AbaP_AGC01]|uniref:DNA binding protein n=1 Tax=Acinetobacter virus vB_AbaP_AGC01 TaxID=2723754 RepID=A0A6H0X2H0_9CAUD|nr:DNA binding protein [Acinetobacter virus vB_AbaP_AGC01]
MNRFKVGDQVRCCNSFGCETLRNGRVYTVTIVRGNTIGLDNGSGTCYNADRFVLFKAGKQEVKEMKREQRVIATCLKGCSDLVIGHSYVGVWHQLAGVVTIAEQNYYDTHFSFEAALTPEKVFEAIRSGETLEVFNRIRQDWQRIENPRCLSYGGIESGIFRIAKQYIDFFGHKVPAPIKDGRKHTGDFYGVSFSKNSVYRCGKQQAIQNIDDGNAFYWANEQDADIVRKLIRQPFTNKTEVPNV